MKMGSHLSEKTVKRIPFRQFKDKHHIATDGCELDREGGFVKILHGMVVDPDHSEFPEEPDDLYDTVVYWECACYLMMALFGWSNPAKGLLWWYENKQNTYGDIRLMLLQEIWNQDDKLDLLAAWFWEQGHRFTDYFHAMALHADRGLCRPVKATPDAEWWEGFHRKFSYEKIQKSNPYFGGYNPLHLIHFRKLWDEPSYKCEPEKLGANSSRAILTLPDVQGWYSALSIRCKELV